MNNSKWLRTKLFFITLVVLVMCIFKPKEVEEMYRLAEKGKEEEDIDKKIAALQSLVNSPAYKERQQRFAEKLMKEHTDFDVFMEEVKE